ncbi:MAG: hypothetical protein ACKOCK_12835, partial [Chloroflexota bacterium]
MSAVERSIGIGHDLVFGPPDEAVCLQQAESVSDAERLLLVPVANLLHLIGDIADRVSLGNRLV